MTCKIVNKTDQDLGQLTQLAQDLYPYSQKRLGFDKPVMVEFHSDAQNANKMLGKTAYYDPSSYKVVLYVDGRHPKDILRSFSHELVHHAQNCRGEFDDHMKVGEGYAQKDKHLREMEKEAYLEGNMILRDWEDKKKEKPKMDEQKIREITRRIIETLEAKRVEERTKRDSADRVAGRDTGGRRLKPLEEEEEASEDEEVVDEASKPDYLDLDKDGDKKEPMKSAAKDAKSKKSDDDSDDDEESVDEAHCPGGRDDDEDEKKDLKESKVMSAKDRHAQRLHEALIKKWCK